MKRLWDRASTWMRSQATRTNRSLKFLGFLLRMECLRHQLIIRRLFSLIGLVLIKKIQYKRHGLSWRTARSWRHRFRLTILLKTMLLHRRFWSKHYKPIPSEKNRMSFWLTQKQVSDLWRIILTTMIRWTWTIQITQRNSKSKYKVTWTWTKSPIHLIQVILHETFKSWTRFRLMQNQTQHSTTGGTTEEEATTA